MALRDAPGPVEDQTTDDEYQAWLRRVYLTRSAEWLMWDKKGLPPYKEPDWVRGHRELCLFEKIAGFYNSVVRERQWPPDLELGRRGGDGVHNEDNYQLCGLERIFGPKEAHFGGRHPRTHNLSGFPKYGGWKDTPARRLKVAAAVVGSAAAVNLAFFDQSTPQDYNFPTGDRSLPALSSTPAPVAPQPTYSAAPPPIATPTPELGIGIGLSPP